MSRRRPDAQVPLEVLEPEPMASGESSLRLTTAVSWEDFPAYAEAVVTTLEGAVTGKADSAAERVREVTIDGHGFWLAFDDFGLGVSLCPRDSAAGELIPALRDRLLAWRERASRPRWR